MAAQIPSVSEMKSSWYERLPKVELHLHLEGAIPYETLWEIMQKYGGDPAVPNLDALRNRFQYKDFPQFIETWIWKTQFLREYDDFSLLAEAVAKDLFGQNIRYVEAFFSPPDLARFNLSTQGLARAIRVGLDRVSGIEVNLIADVVRDWGPELAARTLAEACEAREFGVIGIGMGGSDYKFPPEPFEKVYAEARKKGLHVTAHAGEAAGPESIWGAIQSLQVERIGHGLHAMDDERLLDYLVKKQIPLEVCPLSNVCTGVVSSIEAHPVRSFFERGLFITINTDDPKMFGNSLAGEYRIMEEKLGFSRQEIKALILAGLSASWLSFEQKQRLVEDFCSQPVWQAG